MTWAKFGVEFRGQVMMAGLSDAAARTHFEALLYLYEIESRDLRLPGRIVRTFAGSADHEAGIRELVAAEFWHQDSDGYTVAHHADVYRQSLAAQLAHRETEKQRQRKKRAKPRSDVGTNVGTNVRATQTDRHTRPRNVVPGLNGDNQQADLRGAGAEGDAAGGEGQPATPPHSLREHDGPNRDGPDVQQIPIEVQLQSPAADRNAREACPACGMKQRLRTNGKLARHGPKFTPCRGSGMALTGATP